MNYSVSIEELKRLADLDDHLARINLVNTILHSHSPLIPVDTAREAFQHNYVQTQDQLQKALLAQLSQQQSSKPRAAE